MNIKIINEEMADAPNLELVNEKSITLVEQAILEKKNHKYCHIKWGGNHYVISEKFSQTQGSEYELETFSEFQKNFIHCNKIAGMNQGEAWLHWPGKHFKSGGVDFFPNKEKCPANVFNLFKGYAVKPIFNGNVVPYLEHIEKVICDGDKRASKYLIQFLAHMFQKPEEKPSVAIMLRSVEGTGKGTLLKPLLQILGRHGAQVNGAYQLVGRFNSTIINKLIVFADEVDLTDKKVADKLKGLISEKVVNMERKGMEPEPVINLCRFIFASNHEEVIRAGSKERRYLMLEPNPELAQNKQYFDRLHQWLENDGAANLLGHLLKVDISDFLPFNPPITKALIQQKLSSLSSVDEFFYEKLSKSSIFENAKQLKQKTINDEFLDWCRNKNQDMTLPKARSLTGKALKRYGIDKIANSSKNVDSEVLIPPIQEFREQFASHFGASADDFFV